MTQAGWLIASNRIDCFSFNDSRAQPSAELGGPGSGLLHGAGDGSNCNRATRADGGVDRGACALAEARSVSQALRLLLGRRHPFGGPARGTGTISGALRALCSKHYVRTRNRDIHLAEPPVG